MEQLEISEENQGINHQILPLTDNTIMDGYLFIDESVYFDSFKEFNLFRGQNLFCDVTFKTEDSVRTEITAHRLVLSSKSEYFKTMFLTDMIESKERYVTIRDITAPVLEAIINYCYTGRVLILPKNIEQILRAAHLIQLDKVVKACFDFLRNNIDYSNCIAVANLAERYAVDNVKEEAIEFVQKNFHMVSQTEDFLELDVDFLSDLISSDKLNVACESDVYFAILSWVKHDVSIRSEILESLLSAVRFTQLTRKFLIDTVTKEPLIMDSPKCRSFFVDALDYHLVPERRLQNGSMVTSTPRETTTRFIYMVGGENRTGILDTTERYDVSRGKWEEVTPMLQRRKHPGASVLDGILYVVGGIDDMGHDLAKVEKFDPLTNSWNYASPLEKCRGAVATAVLDGWLYAAGGSHGGSSMRIVERYDPVKNEWAEVSQMRFPRSYFGLAVYAGKLYAIGGYCGICEIEHCEVYDPIGNQWKDVADLNKARMKHGVCSQGERIFAVGGFCSSSVLDSIEKYNFGLNMWLIIKHTLDPRMGTGISTIVSDDGEQDLFIVGGLDSNHIYHSSTKKINLKSVDYSIKSGPSMNEPRVFGGSSSL